MNYQKSFILVLKIKGNFNYEKNKIFILPENTAVLCIGDKPIHMTTIDKRNKKIKINGHSVMMGYLNEKNNEEVFLNNGMMIKRT